MFTKMTKLLQSLFTTKLCLFVKGRARSSLCGALILFGNFRNLQKRIFFRKYSYNSVISYFFLFFAFFQYLFLSFTCTLGFHFRIFALSKNFQLERALVLKSRFFAIFYFIFSFFHIFYPFLSS